MENLITLLTETVYQVWRTFAANWPYLLLSAVVAGLLNAFVDRQAIAAFLQRHRRMGVVAATAAAVGTPLCSCGTMAVILGMMASMMPWAPVVAFLVASPLTSPQELFYSAGLFGWPFALTFFGASIALGLAGGFVAHILESRGWLADQARFRPISGASGRAAEEVGEVVTATAVPTSGRFAKAAREIYRTGVRLLLFFTTFAFLGYFLNGLIPASWVPTLFGGNYLYSVPLAAVLGLPFYLNTEASLPLVRTLMDAGMSSGAALAFMITGAGTSMGALSGMLTIARQRVVFLVVATLWVGAVVTGVLYDLLALGG
jgi:uncharacterized protein